MKLKRMKLRRTKKCASFWVTLYLRIMPSFIDISKTQGSGTPATSNKNITSVAKEVATSLNTNTCHVVYGK